MAVNLHNLIAAINPDVYCDPSVKGEVKDLVKKEGYLKAAEKAKPKEPSFMDIERLEYKSPFDLAGIKNPIEKFNLTYDLSGQPGQILEEIYFWILDYINKDYQNSEKLIDNFVASPGSSLFTDILQKKTRVQEEASRIMGNVNTVIRSILNLIYDLKEYQSLLDLYDLSHSEKKSDRDAALLSLKQRWLDQVDIKRGGSSIKQLAITGANQPNFVLLIDAFMQAESVEKVKDLDLNERMRNLVRQRLQEFFIWLEQSEKALRKRYEVEKNYLKSQVNSVKLYAHWAKPYLKAAKYLQENANEDASFVHTFNTALFELTLMGKGRYDPKDEVGKGILPKMFSNYSGRNYFPIAIVEMKFRTSPETVGQHHRFRGNLEIQMTSYSLNDDEIKIFKENLEKDNLGDVMGAIEGATDDSLQQIQSDIDELLGDKKEKKPDKEEPEDLNPFTALFSFLKWKPRKKDEGKNGLSPDSDMEKVVRSRSIIESRRKLKGFYGTLKGVYNMPSF